MPLSRIVGLVASVCLAATVGCAPAKAIYGERARFSPAFHGYVMAQHDGSDDPPKGAAVLVLRDPLTGNKLLCHDEVVKWREIHEDAALDRIHDHRAALAAGIATSVLFTPAVAVDPMGGLMMLEAMTAPGAFYDLLRTKSAPELLQAAVTLYDRRRYPQATELIERALAKDTAIGVEDVAYYYLGLSYSEQGNTEGAEAALKMFVNKAAVRDVDRYRKAESKLTEMGIPPRICDSMEPVELYW